MRLIATLVALIAPPVAAAAVLRAGAARVDVSPQNLPVRVNCGFLERTGAGTAHPLHAKAIVLDDGAFRVAVVIVDSCMMPRELIDRAKALAAARTGIPPERMLIAATHTHSAPAAMSCLGTDAQDDYAARLPGRIAEAISQAAARLEPARIGWAKVDDYDHTHNRRWIFRPDKMKADPFGALTVRANMHPGYQNPDAVTESGPVDPGLGVVSIQSAAGRPLAVLANYSQHYFGSPLVSADYFGLFSDALRQRIGADSAFVGILSQGTSGDQMWMDYGRPKSDLTLERYSSEVCDRAMEAYRAIRYTAAASIAMAETRLTLGRRVPDAARLQWARKIWDAVPEGKPRSQVEVYAREHILLDREPRRELKLQALRIGQLGIAAIPNEVFAITGLEIKARSPLPFTFNIELANGAEGYIPPPEQHRLGGYTTWPARSAGLEVEAEPRIVETVLALLEKVSGKRRRAPPAEADDALTRAARARHPAAFWPLDGFRAPQGLEGPAALHLTGVAAPGRSVYFAGGRLSTGITLPPDFTVEGWFWPGVEDAVIFAWRAALPVRTWHHVAIVRRAGRLTVYRNGAAVPDAAGVSLPSPLVIGEGFEGRIDNVALHRRALTAEQISDLPRRH